MARYRFSRTKISPYEVAAGGGTFHVSSGGKSQLWNTSVTGDYRRIRHLKTSFSFTMGNTGHEARGELYLVRYNKNITLAELDLADSNLVVQYTPLAVSGGGPVHAYLSTPAINIDGDTNLGVILNVGNLTSSAVLNIAASYVYRFTEQEQ